MLEISYEEGQFVIIALNIAIDVDITTTTLLQYIRNYRN